MPAKRIDLIKEKENIISKYLNGLNTVLIGKMYNANNNTIGRYLKKWGIKIKDKYQCNRTRKFNQNYFDTIDTEEKAYFLGLLYADGCVQTNIRNTVKLCIDDEFLINKFKEALNYDGVIKKRWYKKSTRFLYDIQLHSNEFCQSLINKGCIPNKSLLLDFPNENQVSKEFMSHFIRGYFDGDGCFYIYPNNTIYNTILLGSSIFIDKIQRYLLDIGIKGSSNKPTASKHLLTKELRYSMKATISFYKYIYKDATIYMQRKYNKILPFIKN